MFIHIHTRSSAPNMFAKFGWKTRKQCLSQDIETGCLNWQNFVKFLGVQIFKEDHNILIFQP